MENENMNEIQNNIRREKTGKVWLAGAGPGDAALLTVKTRELITSVDVIVYDALISAEIRSLFPEKTACINVGKRSGCHPVPQDEINEILVREAGAGRKVLRLKGGDPFVFGRGGEEIERLLDAGIPYEVVPGVTSAVAVPAYAGIPVTHRDYTSSFHVITGHARKGKEMEIPFQELVRLNGTLIFLMGITALPGIVRGLLDAGMDPSMPSAVLEKGTSSRQRRVSAPLSELPDAAKEKKIKTPAIIVVGKVCSLSDAFEWAKNRPLGGMQVIVTRPEQSVSAMSDRLRNLGAQVIELPAIRTVPVEQNSALEEALQRFGTRAGEEWLVFTSPAGVRIFYEQLQKSGKDIRWLFGRTAAAGVQIKTAAIGKSTAREMQKYGLSADVVPEIYCAGKLGEAIADAASEDSAVTVLRAREGSRELLPPLEKSGILTEDIPLYDTCIRVNGELHDSVLEMLQNGEIDFVTFTSASTVTGFTSALPEMDFTKICGVCIGEQTAREAEKYGIRTAVSEKATMDSMTELMIQLAVQRKKDIPE